MLHCRSQVVEYVLILFLYTLKFFYNKAFKNYLFLVEHQNKTKKKAKGDFPPPQFSVKIGERQTFLAAPLRAGRLTLALWGAHSMEWSPLDFPPPVASRVWLLSSVPYKDLKIKLMLTWFCKFSKYESLLRHST